MPSPHDHPFVLCVVPNGVGSQGNICKVSLCLLVNNGWKGFSTNGNNNEINAFYASLQKLPQRLKGNIKISAPGLPEVTIPYRPGASPFSTYSLADNTDADDAAEAAALLWKQLFPPRHRINAEARPPAPEKTTVSSLFATPGAAAYSALHYTQAFRRNLAGSAATAKKITAITRLDVTGADVVSDRLDRIRKAAAHDLRLAHLEQGRFIARQVPDLLQNMHLTAQNTGKLSDNQVAASLYDQLKKIQTEAYAAYFRGTVIDLDEVLSTFGSIMSYPFLMRLMGLIGDAELTLPAGFVPPDGGEMRFKVSFEADDTTGLCVCSTWIKGLRRGPRYAYLAAPKAEDDNYFGHSILKDEHTEPIMYNRLAVEQQLRNLSLKAAETGSLNTAEAADVLTRGIFYTHKDLPALTAQEEMPDSLELLENHLSHGYRVATIAHHPNTQADGTAGKSTWPAPAPQPTGPQSLVRRDVRLTYTRSDGRQVNIFHAPDLEGCIQIDAGHRLLDEGRPSYLAGDALFLYAGELLNLKSAFSKYNRIKKSDAHEARIQSWSDIGYEKSFQRAGKCISLRYFPFNEVKTDDEKAPFTISFDVPASYLKGGPKLRYGATYSFIVQREYINGYALPLEPRQGSIALSATELITTPLQTVTFAPLENKKPPVLRFTRKFDREERDIAGQDSLHQCVIRSNGRLDPNATPTSRHILPERMQMEHAFWAGWATPPRVSPAVSYKWKRKYSCPFTNRQDYDKKTNETDNITGRPHRCPESCGYYCGGTHLEDYYTDQFVFTNYISDQDVAGCRIEYFHDRDCTIPVSGQTRQLLYGKGANEPIARSVRLTAIGHAATGDMDATVNPAKDTLVLRIKKGMEVYARLRNLFATATAQMASGAPARQYWWNTQAHIAMAGETLLNDDDADNPPITVSFTHAVSEPLVIPVIHKLFSLPDARTASISHLQRWPMGPYGYAENGNVIAKRLEEPGKPGLIGSVMAEINLQAHFERLDAYAQLAFLKDVIPTGGLELWMRKETYHDDNGLEVTTKKGPFQHFPEDPLLPFAGAYGKRNDFRLEHKIAFDADLMRQLKDKGSVALIPDVKDLFRACLTTLQLHVNVNSTRFEVREYYLKGWSKFKGYFKEEAPAEVSVSDEFVLPKTKDVYNDNALRFRALLLANRRPPAPAVLQVLTTIDEKWGNPSNDKTITHQRGNVLTFRFRRDAEKNILEERIGIIVETKSKYFDYFRNEGLVSMKGGDMLTDKLRPAKALLQKTDIIIPPDTDNPYKAGYDDELGIVHFLPQFDIDTQSWKIEVEMDIKSGAEELHNPFIHFALVQFQPYSINYNLQTGAFSRDDVMRDCRISDVVMSAWGQLLPGREVNATFDKPGLFKREGSVSLTLNFDYASLHHSPESGRVQSNFVATVECSRDKIIWTPVESYFPEQGKGAQFSGYHHPLLDPAGITAGTHTASIQLWFERPDTGLNYRIRLVEVEWFGDYVWQTNRMQDVLHLENMHVRYVELID